jgi:hypothetical protein
MQTVYILVCICVSVNVGGGDDVHFKDKSSAAYRLNCYCSAND